MRKCINIKTGKEDNDPMSLTGFISWRRLAEQLRRAGEFSSDDEPTHFVVEDHGISIRFK